MVIFADTLGIRVKHKGEFRLRNQNREHSFSNADRRNLIQLRARAQVEIKLPENLNFTMVPQGTKTYGEVIATSNDENNTSRLSSGDKFHTGIDLFEAYVESKGNIFSYKLGRQKLGYGDYVILGTRNWTNGGLSFDAAKGTLRLGSGELDIVYSKISEGTDNTNTTDDTDLAFLYYKIIKKKALKLDAYFIRNNERERFKTDSFGVRYKGFENKFHYRLESIIQLNEQLDEREHTFDLELGYQLNKFKPYLGFSQTSANYDHLYTNRHKFNGIIDVLGRRNLETLFLGVNYDPMDSLGIRFKYLNFSQKDLGQGVYDLGARNPVSGDANQKSIGQELDLTVRYEKSDYENIILGFYHFIHGDYFSTSPSNSTFFYLEYLLRL